MLKTSSLRCRTAVSGDRATYARAVENARAIFTRDGHFTPADLETPLKVLREFNTDVAKADIDLSRPTMPSSSVPSCCGAGCQP